MASAFLPQVLQRLDLSQAASEDLVLTKFPECTAGSAVLKTHALEFPSTWAIGQASITMYRKLVKKDGKVSMWSVLGGDFNILFYMHLYRSNLKKNKPKLLF